jgi:hypothetical protein
MSLDVRNVSPAGVTKHILRAALNVSAREKLAVKTFLSVALGSCTKLRRFTNIKQYKKKSLTWLHANLSVKESANKQEYNTATHR